MATTKYSVSAYVADGVTTDFLITWDYLDTDHIAVYVDGVSNSDPSSTFQFSQINSTTIRVTDELGDPITAGLDVEIHRETPILNRAVTFIDGSALLAEDLNKNSDYLLFAMQEAIDTVDIAAQNGAEAAQLATETLRDQTQVLRNETEGFKNTTLTYRDQTYAYLDSVSADVTTVAGIEADVTTVATNIVAVQNADANATTATTKAAEASASAAAALVSENNSATSATNAATSEANAASSAGSAGSSATSAASSATSASSSASSASSSASAADASAISAAQNEALSAANKDAAGVYAGQAASSASAAAVSAGAAATSESNAADTLTIIEGIYDQFDDRYLGPKATDPTLDNDGNALVQGTMYFSTSENAMKVYDGANWVSATSAGGASLLNYNYTATAGQTTFSGADDNAATLSYTQQNLIVTLNGIVLEDGTDYTASNGTSIVLTTAAAAGDELNIVAFKSFTTADMVPASTGGTFSAPVTVNGNNATVLTVDRATSDGTLVDFKKNGVTVGGVGSYAGDLIIGTGDTYLRFEDANDIISPRNADGTGRDAAVSLGVPSVRFKNLYLSGGVYLGGTGSANLLDDYEEGTWTPSFSWASQSNAPSPATTSFRYVKVGSVVHVMGYAWGNFGTGSGVLKCSNMPFVSGYSHTLVPLWSSNMSSPIGGYISGSSTTLSIALLAGSSGNFSSSDITNAAAEIGIQFSYITTA